ncbi:MAG TPA: diguanylate cyclase, partial [Nitrososphaera sp.]|nr:diguanylate cyclase [Nitrososphaera sp.]
MALTEDQSETQNITELSGNGIFQLRVRQAILAAQHSIKQVGLLLIAFDNPGNPLTAPDDHATEFSEAMWMRLRNVLRDSDTVVRMNGGEMAVLLPSVNGPEDVVLVANKILSKLEEPLCIEGLQMQVRPRLGIALFPEHSTNANILMQRADLALTVAKQKRNPYVLYSSEHTRVSRAPLRMSELRQAIVADQLFLLYQPKVNLKDGSVTGVEVL